jgi:hypothetical protein
MIDAVSKTRRESAKETKEMKGNTSSINNSSTAAVTVTADAEVSSQR